MQKPFLALLCAATLCAGLMGCGSKETTNEAAPGVTPGAPPTAPAATPDKGAQATQAPMLSRNPNYNGPAVGSKAGGNQ